MGLSTVYNNNEPPLIHIKNTSEFNFYLLSLFNNIKSRVKLNYSDIEKIKINVNVVEKNKETNRCCAIVEDNVTGETRQCTRKKKFGNVCGLHHNRKNSFNSVKSHSKTESVSLLLDLLPLISKKININSTESLRQISYNYIDYMIDTNNGLVYLYDDELDELTQYDHINNLNIPFVLE